MATALDPSNTLRATESSALAASDPLGALISGYLSRTHRDTVAVRCLPSQQMSRERAIRLVRAMSGTFYDT